MKTWIKAIMFMAIAVVIVTMWIGAAIGMTIEELFHLVESVRP